MKALLLALLLTAPSNEIPFNEVDPSVCEKDVHTPCEVALANVALNMDAQMMWQSSEITALQHKLELTQEVLKNRPVVVKKEGPSTSDWLIIIGVGLVSVVGAFSIGHVIGAN